MLETGKLSLTAAKELARLPVTRQIDAYEMVAGDDGKSPAAKRIKEAVRKIQGEVQPQLSVSLPVIEAVNSIDPVAVGMNIRGFAESNSGKLSCDEYDILVRAAEIIEKL
jgi:hypothetical protein